MPESFAVAVAAGASMAGVPPLLGFMAKEAAIEAALGSSGLERVVVATAIIGGSVLTVAYTVRFLIGVFGAGPSVSVAPRRWAMTVPAVVLGLAGIVGYAAAPTVTAIVGPAAVELESHADVYTLIRWPGLKTAFVISLLIVAGGSVLGVLVARRPDLRPPDPVGADGADAMIDGILAATPRLAGRMQHGSLPVYLATMGIAASLATVPFLAGLSFDHLVLWDEPLQGALAVSIVVAALTGIAVGSRLGAALTLGAVGIGVSGLFIVHGAPDIALTQLLVETVVVVGFVLGLGHLARTFPINTGSWQAVRIAVSVVGGLAVVIALIAAGASPSGQAPIAELTAQAVDEGGGKNVVNVILTDIRGLDTLGEVVVLATVAIGILALARVRKVEAGT